MNFYICSTVRHLLFALLKALAETDQKHRILFFADFQDTSLDQWDLTALPANVLVTEGNRRELRAALTQNLAGQLFYFLAMRNFIAPHWVKEAFFAALDAQHPEFAAEFRNADGRQLWLFNERNKMARAFRLVTQRFALIEEGSANYHYRSTPWWQWPFRALLGRPANKLAVGEDPRCLKILVSYPEKLPPTIRAKALPIMFLDTESSKATVRQMFATKIDFDALKDAVILATSPLDEIEGIDKQSKLELYKLIFSALHEANKDVVVKLHPRETFRDYADSGWQFAPEKLPLEIFILLSPMPITIMSFFTSAGIGLESYFRLIELCNRSDSKGYEVEKLSEWIKHPDRLKALVASRIGATQSAPTTP